MSNAVQWLMLAVRNVTSVAIPPLAERVHSSLPVLAATNEHARMRNVANVPDAPISVSDTQKQRR